MVSYIEIKFCDDKVIFSPGEKVKGNVLICNDVPVKLNGISLRFRGKSHTSWYDHARKACYSDEEYYVDNTVSLWPEGKTMTSSDFPIGNQSFSFEFDIPENAPCSFEGQAGWVRYSVYVTVDRPNSPDKIKKAFVSVLPKADLNLDPRAKSLPRQELKEGIGFLSKKIIALTASCNKGGYVPGEPIQVSLDIQNDTEKDISKIKVELQEKAAFRGKGFGTLRRVDKRTAAKVVETVDIKSKTRKTWLGNLRVPSLPPSDLPGCSIIDLQYRLVITVKCGTFQKVSFKMPFIIGTIPLISDVQSGFQQLDFSDNPPTYMESVFGTVDGLEDDKEELLDKNQYSPLYSYYQCK